jgi:hypothetical protein
MPQQYESRTFIGEQRVSGSVYYDPPADGERHGKFKGRPIIGSHTRINGGVYLGGGAREAIVVDDVKQQYLRKAYGVLRESVVRESPLRYRWRGKISPSIDTMSAVYRYTQLLLPYNDKVVRDIRHGYPPDEKIALVKFIAEGGGQCRHQALLAGYFLEKLVDDGLLVGEAHVVRNETAYGPHAWAQFTPDKGEAFIIDAAQNFVGTVSQAATSAHWKYTTPE